MFTFIKNNIYIIAGALCVVIICALYFTQNGERNESALPQETEATVIYSSETDEADSADGDQPGAGVSEANQSVPAKTSEPQNISVYITGEVVNPGVYELPSGSRVWQALEQAGGFTERAAEDHVNLAAYVADTQQITVPSADDPAVAEIEPGTSPYGVTPEGKIVPEAKPPAAEHSSSTPGNITAGSAGGGLIDINTADSALLQTLPGIGEQIASYIIEYREQNGGFKSADEILNVNRIGAVTFEEIKDKITTGGM